MKFKDIDWPTSDQQAYINTKILYNNNYQIFNDLYGYKNELQDIILFHIYKVFSYLQDKGSSYTRLSQKDNSLIIFKEGSFHSPGTIYISLYSNFISIESPLTKHTGNRNFIRLTFTNKDAYITGFIKTDNNPTTTIRGSKKEDNPSLLEINTPQRQYLIKNDEPWHIFSIMVENTLNDPFITNCNNLYNKLLNLLYQKGLSKYQDELFEKFNKYFNSNINPTYYQNELSLFLINKSLQEYLESISFNNHISIKKSSINGLSIGEDSIKKFATYKIIDQFSGDERKLTDIHLSFLDTTHLSKCDFLDALNQVPIEDIDIYIVGLVYFATYCTDFGPLSGNNFYGANIYPRYAGHMMNIAINSKVLGIPLAEYAYARYNNNGENYPQICSIFKMFGFDFSKHEIENQLVESHQPIDTTSFKEILPYQNRNSFPNTKR